MGRHAICVGMTIVGLPVFWEPVGCGHAAASSAGGESFEAAVVAGTHKWEWHGSGYEKRRLKRGGVGVVNEPVL